MAEKSYKDFYELPIYRVGYNLLMEIYNLTVTFPESEKFNLTSQLRRSANSIVANIAESHGRYSYNDKVRVLYIARGEILETRSHLAVAYGRQYLDDTTFKKINTAYCDLAKEMNSYIKSIKV